MIVIYFLLPFALLLGFVFVGGFLWVVAQGQYDELETPAHRMLLGDDVVDVPSLTSGTSRLSMIKRTR